MIGTETAETRTPDQIAAIETHDRPLIVVAGAGSGKTFVLVNRFMRLLECNPGWRLNQIVAITFTEKAAGEMRDRVRLALTERHDAGTPDQARWAMLLAQMDSARISTIHSLCTSILRANAAEAGIDPRFTVLNEVDAALAKDDAIDDVLRQALDEDSPALVLIAEYSEEKVRQALASLLLDPATRLEAYTPEEWLALWQAEWRAEAVPLLAAFARNVPPVERYSYTKDDKFWPTWETLCGLRAELGALMPRITSAPLDAFSRAAQIVGEIGKLSVGNSKARGGVDADALKQAFNAIRLAARETEAAIGPPPDAHDQRAGELMALWCSLAEAARSRYHALKQERAALDMDDLEVRTAHLLEDESVASRYRSGEFQQVMVDEFQDTNRAQWTIARALAPADSPRLFCVGDPKQSIYKFRGADVEVFEEARGLIGQHGREVALAQSFRTHAPLVGAFNHLFAQLMQPAPDALFQTAFGTPMTAARAEAPNALPPLELHLFNQAIFGKSDDAPSGEGATDLARHWEADDLARRVRALIESGRLVYDRALGHTRPVGYDDVVLLFQRMTNASLYEDALRAHGIPYFTIAGRGYYNRQEVWDVLNLLTALDNPGDDLSLASALHSPLFDLSDDALLALRLAEPGHSLWAAVQAHASNDLLPPDEREACAFAATTLAELRALAGRVTAAELMRAALDRTGYLAAVTGVTYGIQRRLNVEKLLEKARTSGLIRLSDFVDYIQQLNTRAEVREGDAASHVEGCVTLMTVHKSKGLEFPVVVLVDTGSEGVRPSADAVTYDSRAGLGCRVYDLESDKFVDGFATRRNKRLNAEREDAERRRLLYVAATRAQDLLIIGGQYKVSDKNPFAVKGWLAWLCEAFAIEAPDDAAPASGGQVQAGAWGELLLRFAPSEEGQALVQGRSPAASVPAVRVWPPAPVGAFPAPPNMPAVISRETTRARSLTATQIAHMGAFTATHDDEQARFRRTWRATVLHDAPDTVPGILQSLRQPTPRQIGEIVHKALRWYTPARPPDSALFDHYAWEEGIVAEHDRQTTTRRAQQILQRVIASQSQRWIDAAHAGGRTVLREVPFVFQTERRTIYGVIDVLFEDEDGSWVVLDYKTSYVPPAASLEDHARRFYLQVGVYAAAAREVLRQSGTAPMIRVYIQYIARIDAPLVLVPTEAWEGALTEIERVIGQMVDETDNRLAEDVLP